MQHHERTVLAALVGLSGAAVMGTIVAVIGGGPDGPPFVAAAFAGAAVAGFFVAQHLGKSWPVAILASLTATVVGAAIGAFLVRPGLEALFLGPVTVLMLVFGSPVAFLVWALSQSGVHLAARVMRRRGLLS